MGTKNTGGEYFSYFSIIGVNLFEEFGTFKENNNNNLPSRNNNNNNLPPGFRGGFNLSPSEGKFRKIRP